MKRLLERMLILCLALALPLTALAETITPEPLPADAPAVTLRVAGGYNNDICDTFQRMNPGITIEFTQDSSYSANEIITALLTRDATYDVMQFNTSGVDVKKVIDQGYALDMSASEKISAYVNSLYPELRDMVSRDGRIYAVPLHLFSNDGGCYPKNFEDLGLEIPTTWQEVAALINAWPDQPDEVRENYEINEWTLDYRDWFLTKATDAYVTHMEAVGEELHFDTPLYRELVGLVDTMTTENDTEEERDVLALMGNGYIEPFQMGYSWDTPMVDLAIDGRVAHTVVVFLAMINPYTEHTEEALRCIEFMIDRIAPATRQTMVDAAYITPMENPDYPRLMAEWEANQARLEKKLEESDEADKADVEQELRRHEDYRAWIENAKWLITEESIPAYAEVFKTLYFPKPSVLMAKDQNDPYGHSIADILQARYLDGQIDMDTYVRELESRIQMVLLERGE